MTTESVTTTDYGYNQIGGRSVSEMDRATSSRRRVCGVCHEFPVHAKGRCMTCYQSVRRTGVDRPMSRIHDKRERPVVVPRRMEPDDGALTYAEWCKANGFDPKRRKYRPA